MKRLIIIKRIVVLLLVTASAAPCFSVHEIIRQIQQAENLEKAGRVEEAGVLFEQIHTDYPGNDMVFSQYRAFCMRVGDYGRAMALIDERMKTDPGDPSLSVFKAQALYRQGHRKESLDAWRRLLEAHAGRAIVYEQVASAMTAERLFEEAIDVYLLGRERIGKPHLFHLSLVTLYGAIIEYGHAADELLGHLQARPRQYSFVESELLKFPKTRKTVSVVTERIREAIEKSPSDLQLRKLLARVYENGGFYTEGLNASREADRLLQTRKQGDILLAFANRVMKTGTPEIALTAYRQIRDQFPAFYKTDQVVFNTAVCYEALNRHQEAVSWYEQVEHHTRDRRLIARALLSKGLIQKNSLHDFSGAVQTFETVLRQFTALPFANQVQLELGGCHIALGRIEKAVAIYRRLLEELDDDKRLDRMRILVRLSDALYLQGRFDDAVGELGHLKPAYLDRKSMRDPVLNDGLNLKLFLQQHSKQSPEPLIMMARGDYLFRQRQFDAAAAVLDSLVTGWPGESVTAHALYRLGEIAAGTHAFREALAGLDSLLVRFPDHWIADRALAFRGEVLEKMGRRKQALENYDRFLIDYPRSLMIDEIRRRIAKLEEG